MKVGIKLLGFNYNAETIAQAIVKAILSDLNLPIFSYWVTTAKTEIHV